MIASLRGPLIRLEATYVVLEAGGVGYKVSVPVSVLSTLAVGAQASLFIHTYIRAEEMSLYGFASADDQRVFEMLLSVTGIGPRVALSILSAMDSAALVQAVTAEDTKTLVRIPGLGQKIAGRLVLELRDKLAALNLVQGQAAGSKPAEMELFDDVIDGLVNLGYNRNDARRAAEKAVKNLDKSATMGEALKAALNVLTGSGSRI